MIDRGYRGHGVETTRVLISGTRQGITPVLAKLLRRRSAIEPEIGHMKTDGRLARYPLKGTAGDAIFAVLCACGHNLRKTLAHLRALLSLLLAAILTAIGPPTTTPQGPRRRLIALFRVNETVASNRGVGNIMMIASSSFNVPLVFAGLLVLATMGVSLYVLFALIERRVVGWAMRKDGAV